MALVILALGIMILGSMYWHPFLGIFIIKKHFCLRAGVFPVSGIPQKYFQITLENTIKFCSLE